MGILDRKKIAIFFKTDCERATLRGVVQIPFFERKCIIYRFESKQVHLGSVICILLNQHLHQRSCPMARQKSVALNPGYLTMTFL